jgi:glycolate oxidase
MIPQKIIEELIGVVGERFVLYAPEDLIVFEYDGSQATGYPEVVVVPGSAEEVAQTVKIAHREGIPVVPRGAGTSISGGALASIGGILLPLTRLKKVLEVDTENLLAVVEPGLVNVDLSAAVSQFGLFYAPDPSSQKACTIGGNVSENAGGPHCLSYGVTTNHVLGLEVVLHNGDMMWVGGKVRDVPGYDLTGAIVGSEGTFVVVTKVIVRLMAKPESVKTLLAVYDDPIDATNTVSAVIGAGIIPAALEMIDNVVIRAVEKVIKAGFPMDAGAVLLIEVEGLEESAREEASAIKEICKANKATLVRAADDPAERERLWAGRKSAFGALGSVAPNYYIVDGVVPRSKLPEVMKKIEEIFSRYQVLAGNVFHAGDGNLHPIILFDEHEPGVKERVIKAGGEVMRACIDVGGALTGEHGIGVEKQMYMPWAFTQEDMDAMKRLRAAFNPKATFNPGKIFPDEAPSHQESALHRPVPQVSGMYV